MVEFISAVFGEKVLAPDLDVPLALSSSHSMTGGIGDSLSAVFQHEKPHGNKFLISVSPFLYVSPFPYVKLLQRSSV